MLTVSYGQLRDEPFQRAMVKMANCSGLKSPKVSYNIAKIHKRVQDEAKLSDEIYQKLVDEYAKKDEKGEIEPVPGRGTNSFAIPKEKVKEWTTKLAEFNSITFEVDRPPIQLVDVRKPAGLTPAEIVALDMLLLYDESMLEEEETAKDAAKPALKSV